MAGSSTVADYDQVVVGAGLSGLVAATRLAQAGQRVVVLDKGRGVGGRLATRRIGGGRADHGAQFFTVRSPEFQEMVEPLLASGLVQEWCRGFGDTDGYPRYRVREGMTSLAKALAADLDVRTAVHVDAVSEDGSGGFRCDAHTGDEPASFHGVAVALTSPVPQTLALLEAGELQLDAELTAALRSITYEPTVVLLVVLDGPSAVPDPGAVQNNDPDFGFVSDNNRKGISPDAVVLTLHANATRSTALLDRSDDDVLDTLLPEARRWFGDSAVLEVQVKRWRYATPVELYPAPVATAVLPSGTLYFGGDAFAGPRVEGAFSSGVAIAEAMLRT